MSSWFILCAAGVGCLILMKRTGPRGDAVLQRLAGGAFMGAGLAGLTGWLGTAVTGGMAWALATADRLGGQVVGSAVAWVIVAGLGLAWVCAMLPNKIVRASAPTWLVVSGVVLPSLLTQVPGTLGAVLRDFTTWAGTLVGTWVGGMVS